MDVIDAVLSDTERGGVRRDRLSWLRPRSDHTPWFRKRPVRVDAPTRRGIWPTEDRPLPAYATTSRPHAAETIESRLPDPEKTALTCDNTVGTTGFEPATP